MKEVTKNVYCQTILFASQRQCVFVCDKNDQPCLKAVSYTHSMIIVLLEKVM